MKVRARIASILALASALAALLPVSRLAAQDPGEPGRRLAETCLGCHGIEGYFNAYPSYRVPKLGGQNAEYIVLALQAYKNGERSHDTMHSQAATLSEDDMRALAAWFARRGESPVDAAQVPQQAQSCAACHGANGISTLPQYPHLAGQHADYLTHTLRAYKRGERKNPIMAGLATPLTEPDIEGLARYYASLRGLTTPER